MRKLIGSMYYRRKILHVGWSNALQGLLTLETHPFPPMKSIHFCDSRVSEPNVDYFIFFGISMFRNLRVTKVKNMSLSTLYCNCIASYCELFWRKGEY